MKEFYKDIVSLCSDYTMSNKLADKKFILEVTNKIVSCDDTKDLLKKIVFDIPDSEDTLACYNYKNRCMRFNEFFLNNEEIFDDIEDVLEYNIQVLQYVLHECSHILQYKNYDNDNIENRLLKYTVVGNEFDKETLRSKLDVVARIRDLNIDYNLLNNMEIFGDYCDTQEIYDLSPAERMAEIRSYKILRNVVLSIKFRNCNDIISKIDMIIKKNEESGYSMDNKISSPIEKYYQLLTDAGMQGIDKSLLEILEYKTNLSKKLYYGLPISEHEYEKIKARKI